MLGTKPRSSARVVSVLNHTATYLSSPHQYFIIIWNCAFEDLKGETFLIVKTDCIQEFRPKIRHRKKKTHDGKLRSASSQRWKGPYIQWCKTNTDSILGGRGKTLRNKKDF